jgi:hypothetical protein
MDEIRALRARLERVEKWGQERRAAELEASNARLEADVLSLRATGKLPDATPAAPKPPERPAERVYRSSELADRAFYVKHRDDILLAARQGRVIDDQAAEPDAAAGMMPPAPVPATGSGSGNAGPRGGAPVRRLTAASLADRSQWEANKAEIARRRAAHEPLLDER